MSKTVFHIFGFRWKPEATEELKQRATRDLLAFNGIIPGLLQIHVGENLSPRNQGYTYCGVMEFTNQGALESYVVHPAHQALLKWLVPLIDAVELDVQT